MTGPATPFDASGAPSDQLRRLAFGFRSTRAIGLAAELGLADALSVGPKTVVELAAISSSHPPSLRRLMRFLVALDVFRQDEDGRYALTPLGQALRADVSGSMRSTVLNAANDRTQGTWAGLGHSVRTGESAYEHVWGISHWEYLAQDPEALRRFNTLMVERRQADARALVQIYDFSSFKQVTDVAGGRGQLLLAILAATPGLRGVLFDQPAVVEDARPSVQASGVADRCELIAGSFFDAVPPGSDLHLLGNVLHDWDDARAMQVLRTCHQALAPGGTLLIVERVMPIEKPSPDQAGFDAALFDMAAEDLNMMVSQSGQQRTEVEHRALLAQAGFRLTRVLPMTLAESIVEAVRRPVTGSA